MGLQAWRQPRQAKKGKKGAEPWASSASATEHMSAKLDSVHDTLASGVKVSRACFYSDRGGLDH